MTLKKWSLIASVLLLLPLYGCKSGVTDEPVKPPDRAEIAESSGKALLEAIRHDDFKQFCKQFDRMTEDEFKVARQRMKEQFGDIESFAHLARMNTPGGLEHHVWRVEFVRMNQEHRAIRQDVLFRIVSGNDEGKERIIGFGFL